MYFISVLLLLTNVSSIHCLWEIFVTFHFPHFTLPILLTNLKAFSYNSKSLSRFEVLTPLLMIHILWDKKLPALVKVTKVLERYVPKYIGFISVQKRSQRKSLMD